LKSDLIENLLSGKGKGCFYNVEKTHIKENFEDKFIDSSHKAKQGPVNCPAKQPISNGHLSQARE
jgi:hypothetical protein